MTSPLSFYPASPQTSGSLGKSKPVSYTHLDVYKRQTVYRYTHSGNTAVGVPFSTTFFASFNDGAICPRAVVEPTADLQVTKTADPNPATAGGPLTYSIKNYKMCIRDRS